MDKKILSFKQIGNGQVQESATGSTLLTVDCSKLSGVRTEEVLYMKGVVSINSKEIDVDTNDRLYRKSNEAYQLVAESFDGQRFDALAVYETLALVDALEGDYDVHPHDLVLAIVAECVHPGVVSSFSIGLGGELVMQRTRGSGNIQHADDLA